MRRPEPWLISFALAKCLDGLLDVGVLGDLGIFFGCRVGEGSQIGQGLMVGHLAIATSASILSFALGSAFWLWSWLSQADSWLTCDWS